jgi:hypothetical protein
MLLTYSFIEYQDIGLWVVMPSGFVDLYEGLRDKRCLRLRQEPNFVRIYIWKAGWRHIQNRVLILVETSDITQ